MQTFDSEDKPPPMPSSWRPYGSGLPMAARNSLSCSARSAGRSAALNTNALLVPPRMKAAGILTCGMGCFLRSARSVGQQAGQFAGVGLLFQVQHPVAEAVDAIARHDVRRQLGELLDDVGLGREVVLVAAAGLHRLLHLRAVLQ